MTERERIIAFDKKVKEYENKRSQGVGNSNPLVIVLEILCSIFLLCFPVNNIGENEYMLIMIHIVMAGSAGMLHMSWLLAVAADGKVDTWKNYLKYVPVDWKEFRRYRYELLFKYTGQMFLCYGGAQLFSTIWWAVTRHGEFNLWGVVYAAILCVVSILLPGIFRIRRWT